MIVYKYLPVLYGTEEPMKYKNDFLKGKIWVNTYDGIRTLDLEKANLPEDTSIKDTEEGKSITNTDKVIMDKNQPQEKNKNNINKFFKLGLEIQNCKSVIVKNSKFIGKMRNAHMFCVTKERNDLHWTKEKYDSCVEILDFEKFMERLKEAIEKEHDNLNWKYEHTDCKYIGRDYNFDDMDENFNPHAPDTYFLKPSSIEADFYKQKEYRFVAIPEKQNFIIAPQTYKIDPTGLFKDCKAESKEYHTITPSAFMI